MCGPGGSRTPRLYAPSRHQWEPSPRPIISPVLVLEPKAVLVVFWPLYPTPYNNNNIIITHSQEKSCPKGLAFHNEIVILICLGTFTNSWIIEGKGSSQFGSRRSESKRGPSRCLI